MRYGGHIPVVVFPCPTLKPHGSREVLVHLTTGNALLFAAPGALAPLDLGLSTPICKIALAENGVVRFFAYNSLMLFANFNE